MPQCRQAQFASYPIEFTADECPADTAVGAAAVTVIESNHLGLTTVDVPVFNLVPEGDEPARFGFFIDGVTVALDTSVRTGEGYGITVNISNIAQGARLLASTLSLWGVPNDPRHDGSRGWACIEEVHGNPAFGTCRASEHPSLTPFLRLPSSCTESLSTPLGIESWNGLTPEAPTFNMAGLGGCNRVPFEPRIEAASDVQQASSASGLTLELRLPQNQAPEGIGEADLDKTTVTLPEGVTLNPSDARGLESCPLLTGRNAGQEELEAHGEVVGINLETKQRASCPDASKIGTVKIKTPLLPSSQPFEGSIYLATPAPNGEAGLNPYNSLLAMYIVAEDKEAGVLIKVPLQVPANPVTGRLTAISEGAPQLPFETLELHFFGGERAPLSTPAHCGSYTTAGSFEPYSGGPEVLSESTFEVNSGAGGGACPGASLPFTPSLTAGTTSIQAGDFSPFTMTMGRADGNQNLQTATLNMPEGLTGFISGVKLCGEAQANAGTCPPESQIGETTVSVGVGREPFTVTGGKVFLTEKYQGAPFGLSIVNPANAGPFHLGNVIVRAKIEVNSLTSALTVSTNQTGPYRIPTILDGIPLQIQHINVTIGRPGFMVNPTSCAPMDVTGALTSSEGANDSLSVPFQVTNCAALSFKPEFKVQTSAKTSRTEGASLRVTLRLPAGAEGTKANVAKVKVSLPKRLPSPLKTLQKACTEKVFAENPSSCPKASNVGEAKVTTPVLEGGLSGPAYFVSHGGAKYPELIFVLTGEDGVTVQVHGETFISKQGITTATFSTVPDVPFSTFELTLPKREYPALTANGNLCKGTLLMPTELVGQNGLKINEETKISVTGCPKTAHKKAKRKKAKHPKKHKKR